MTEVEVLVVGAGPVGLSLAGELLRHGVSCRIIDQNEGPTDQSRALGLHARTLEIFEDFGIIDEVLARGKKLHGLSAHAGGRRIVHVEVALDDLGTPYPYIVVLPQSATERILMAGLAGRGGAVERYSRLERFVEDEEGVSAVVADVRDGNERTIRARRLVGCDGARSVVRKQLGLPFAGAEYEEPFLLADVAIDWDADPDEIHAVLTPEGPVAAFPFPEPGRWRLVDLSGTLQSNDPAQVVDRFRTVLTREWPTPVTVRDPAWVSTFTIHRRVVDRFRSGRCFVAGDAAHIHSPAGGQGMNTGIQDAYNLAWKLALVAAGDARDPEALLDSYSQERRPVVSGVLRGTDWLTRIITLRHPVAEAIRNQLASLLSDFEFIQRRLIRGASELVVNYRQSPIVAEDRGSFVRAVTHRDGGPGLSGYLDFGTGPHPGDRVPDVPLDSPGAGAGPARLFEVLRGTRHTLLAFTGTAPTGEDATRLAAVGRLILDHDRLARRVHPVLVVHGETPPPDLAWDGTTLLDPNGAVHARYGAEHECLYLVRPDGYLGYRSQPADPERLLAYLEMVIGEGDGG